MSEDGFKVGDRVRVITIGGLLSGTKLRETIGEVGVIIRKTRLNGCPWVVAFQNGKDYIYATEELQLEVNEDTTP